MKKVIILCLNVALVFASCKKDQSPTNSDGFNSLNDIKGNPAVHDAIGTSGMATYDGTNPPNIEGTYQTDSCTYYGASKNLLYFIGQHPNSIVQFFGQTSDGHIKFLEEKTQVSSSGSGEFITGTSNYFTIWMKSANNNGSTTIVIISGSKIDASHLNIKGLTVFVNNPPKGSVVGDWWAYQGVFR